MPAQKSYSQDYIGGCRERLWAQIALYDEADADAVLESVFFNNLVIVLEATFMHRDRDQEGTNGNALGEVRVLAASLMDDGVTMAPTRRRASTLRRVCSASRPATRSPSRKTTSFSSPTRSSRSSRDATARRDYALGANQGW